MQIYLQWTLRKLSVKTIGEEVAENELIEDLGFGEDC
jgi:hypothetical protein